VIYTIIHDGQVVKFDGKVTTVFSEITSPSLYAEFETWVAEGNEPEIVEPPLIPMPEETD
jgi:hypothetical protein